MIAARLIACAAAAGAIAPPQVTSARTVAQHLWTTRQLFDTDIHAIVQCGSGPSEYRLAYMPCRNRGEIIRLMLEEARCSYELEVVGFRAWARDVKASTPDGKLPCLRNYDGRGTDLCQEGAITRFLADKLGLAGSDAAERAAVDAMYCFWFSTLRNNGVSHDGEHYSVAALKEADEGLTAAKVPPYEDVFRLDPLSRAERSLVALKRFEEVLGASKSGYLVGDQITYPDHGLFYILYELAEDDNVPDFAERFALPHCGAFLDRMAARPQLADFLASPRRMPRYARDPSGSSTYLYVAGRASPEILEA